MFWESSFLIILGAYLILQLWQLFWVKQQRISVPKQHFVPKISVLLAARDEEENIVRCLKSLSELEYPDYEIIVGNDRSEDNTLAIINAFIATHKILNIKVVDIVGRFPKTMAKAAVLAELAHEAAGEIFFITDADIAVPKTWLRAMVPYYQDKNIGIVSGTTFISGKGFFGKLQSIDWLYFMCLVETFHRAGVNTTAIGNNMSVRASAYWQTGGYENIPFSITEDYKIYQKITGLDWKAINVCNAEVLAIGLPIIGLKNLLYQRKRWLLGAKELPTNWWFLFIIFAFYYPASIALFFVNFKIALIIFALKFMLQSHYILYCVNRLKISPSSSMIYLFWYEIYLYTATLSTLLFFILPFKTIWKGRAY